MDGAGVVETQLLPKPAFCLEVQGGKAGTVKPVKGLINSE
jgi:hypothetical protein